MRTFNLLSKETKLIIDTVDCENIKTAKEVFIDLDYNLDDYNLKEEKTNLIEDLINKKNPFAIFKYYEWLITMPNNRNVQHGIIYKDEDGNVINKDINDSSVDFFKKNLDKFNCVKKNKNGEVYEFLNFKNTIPANFNF